jgi:CheY-like chemotaxis protein
MSKNFVLVVDDDPSRLKGVQRLLRQHAYEPVVFSSAEAFKRHTDFEKTDCIILDINLQDGSDALRFLQSPSTRGCSSSQSRRHQKRSPGQATKIPEAVIGSRLCKGRAWGCR